MVVATRTSRDMSTTTRKRNDSSFRMKKEKNDNNDNNQKSGATACLATDTKTRTSPCHKSYCYKTAEPVSSEVFDAPKPWRSEEIEEEEEKEGVDTSDKADETGEENGANETQSRERRHLLTFKAAEWVENWPEFACAPLKAPIAAREQRGRDVRRIESDQKENRSVIGGGEEVEELFGRFKVVRLREMS